MYPFFYAVRICANRLPPSSQAENQNDLRICGSAYTASSFPWALPAFLTYGNCSKTTLPFGVIQIRTKGGWANTQIALQSVILWALPTI